ncbi:LuxR C-terminal-related transcriptional regulator [Pseudohoeflea coraliihabitans]|uniref:LuxR C-terminal-related transcriptional regulator n=1 Tax=Pseudohoeflea coraliihabitans TaxID=2860393 RepID=A0ABS6WRK1_9HYPH|nr:LuxR C-terminal-related transcriptional regulator [Pseudohoeflea sp. DP4N28-3]MBW3098578.1 LuxR C-terminal-related transcriptional regulator [Pseudohoeflea sp. DP4N28-3]
MADQNAAPSERAPPARSPVARVVAAIDTADFFPAMTDYLRSVVPFRGIFVTHLHRDRPPGHVYDNVRAERHRVVVNQYLDSAYLLDPVYDAYLSGRINCAMRLRDIAPDRFRSSTYFRRYYQKIVLRDEMALLVPMPGDDALFYSLGRLGDEPRFTARAVRAFQDEMPVITALTGKHFDRGRHGPSGPRDVPAGPSLTAALEAFGRDVLTAREREVATLILKGHSSASVAAVAGIAVATVKIHRKNIYRKLGLSSQSELLSLFLRSVLQ